MTISQRAAQIWPLLCLAAEDRRTFTYERLGKLIGVPPPGLGQLLEPIQSLCLNEKLPALTSLVVSGKSGMPGVGFIAAEDIPAMHQEVFGFDWIGWKTPTPEEFQAAVEANPSNARPEAIDS